MTCSLHAINICEGKNLAPSLASSIGTKNSSYLTKTHKTTTPPSSFETRFGCV